MDGWMWRGCLAATTAILRVQAGKHFYTDILAGAVAGSAIGLLISYLHRRVLPARGPLQSALGRLRVSVVPSILPSGGGMLVTVQEEDSQARDHALLKSDREFLPLDFGLFLLDHNRVITGGPAAQRTADGSL